VQITREEWLLWPQAVTWLLCRDHARVAELGDWFRTRMAANRSADRVYELRLSQIALEDPDLPEDDPARSLEAAAKIEAAEFGLVRILEQGACVARGKRLQTSSSEIIPAWDWADSTISATRTFELRGAHLGETKFHDVRVNAVGLPGWTDPESVSDQTQNALQACQTTLNWTDEQMRAAIAECGITNREEAWKQIFRDKREDHGWDVEAFRHVWSEARNTKGMRGRPPKRSRKSAQ